MPGNPREIVTMAKRRLPRDGLGRRHTEITGWLDGNCGADGWAITPPGVRGVLNDAISIYFPDATLASAFVARWCAASKVETEGGVFRIRDDGPAPRIRRDWPGRLRTWPKSLHRLTHQRPVTAFQPHNARSAFAVGTALHAPIAVTA